MSIKTLIVDDSPETLEILTMLFDLHKDVHIIGAVQSAKEAWQLLLSESVDLITIDIQLGSDDGLELCRKVHEHFPLTFVTICSVQADLATQDRSQVLGARRFLAKPISYPQIEGLVAEVAAERACFAHRGNSHEGYL